MFATGFKIEYFRTFKIVRDLKTPKTYVLHQCGAGDAPLAADLPADAVDAPVFTVPVQSWSTCGTTPLGFMELLALSNKAVVFDPSYASSSCLLKLEECGVLRGVGGTVGGKEACPTAVGESTSTLQIVGNPRGRNPPKIDVSFSATSDTGEGVWTGALARAEWIKYLAAFFNLELLANSVFAGIIEAKFNQTKALTAAAVAGGAVAPKVLWIANQSAYPASGTVLYIATASYKLDYVHAAGGVTPSAADLAVHCTADSSTSAVSAADNALGYTNGFTCDDAGLKAVLAGIDVVIDETYCNCDTYAFSDFMANFGFSSAQTATDYPFLNKVLRTDRLMDQSDASGSITFGTAWFEDAIPRADISLDDLAFYLHPTLMPSTYDPSFFRNIAANEMVTLATAAACATVTCPPPSSPPPPPSPHLHWTEAFETESLKASVRPKSQPSPGAVGVGVAQTALVVLAVGALLATVARRRSASTML